MLRVRVIPTLLWRDFGLVKGERFDSWRRVGAVRPAIRVYNARDVDELALFDVTATAEGRRPDAESVAEFAEDCFVPLTVGGGVTSVEDMRALLRAGADKIAVNSAAVADLRVVAEGARLFGAQCVVASIDARRHADGRLEVFDRSGTRPTGLDPVDWARRLVGEGAGEVLITSIDRDGTMTGYDLPLIEAVAVAVDAPVIASGGAGSYEDMRRAVQEAGASAVAAASLFHFTEATPAAAKAHLAAAGVPVRTPFAPIG